MVDPINDQPTFVNIENLETSEDTSIALSDISGFKIEDPDAVYDDPNAIYTLTLSVDQGTLTYTSSTGVTSTPTSGSAIVLSGTLANINTALDAGSVRFELGADENYLNQGGVATVTATVNDGGNNGSSGPLNNQTTFEIKVTEVNDDPMATDIDLGTIAEDDQIVIKAEDLIAASSDPEGDNLTITDVSLTSGQGQLDYFENSGGVDDPLITGPYWVFDANDEYDTTSGDISFTYTIQDDGQTNGVDDFLTDTAI